MGDVIVLDIGKSSAKLSRVDQAGNVRARLERPNKPVIMNGLKRLDFKGIESWLVDALAEIGTHGDVKAIVPVAHGAAAAVLKDGVLATAPLDYEQELPPAERSKYEAERDPFPFTGSPSLPAGLNLGAQFHLLDIRYPGLFDGQAQIVTWPQYWAWRLCGVAACELTSLGCHTDLWRPLEGRPTALSRRRGWADRMAPLRRANESLASLSPEWVERTGLSPRIEILCGIHDSNAALLAARCGEESGDPEVTLLSTGTWFVAMKSAAADRRSGFLHLDERRDCLVNVDFLGRPVPSSRFMGGREIQHLLDGAAIQIDDPLAQQAMIDCLPAAVRSEAMVLPSLVSGVGPFPNASGGWVARPGSAVERACVIALYVALVAREALDLIGANDKIIIEGRFARSLVFARALASLSAPGTIFVAEAESDLALGAAALVYPALRSRAVVKKVEPLKTNIVQYQLKWRERTRARERI